MIRTLSKKIGIEDLDPTSTENEIRVILKSISSLPTLEQEILLKRMKTLTQNSISLLRELMIQEGNECGIDDAGYEIVARIIRDKFDNKKTIINGADQQFWFFKGTHWEPVRENIIDNIICDACKKYKQVNPHNRTALATLMGQTRQILIGYTASEKNLSSFRDNMPSVINTKNCEVWIESDTGQFYTRQHSPESYLTHCLNVHFDTSVECPLFLETLRQIFQNHPDTDEVIRHLFEVIGYIMQPEKNIPAWVLFHGSGANGKTLVLNIITSLLGSTALNKTLSELDPRTNNHALADLPGKLAVIDEDISAQTVLPDGPLKKISENKELTANPKMNASFQFTNTAIVLFASNEYPKAKDLSHGMKRRALIFDFNKTFSIEEQNPYLAKNIIDTEMDGILNMALAGLQRFRQRASQWLIPKSCKVATDNWLSVANPVKEFSISFLESVPGHKEVFKDLFDIYYTWHNENMHTYPLTKSEFKFALQSLAFVIRRSTGNKFYCMDCRLLRTEE